MEDGEELGYNRGKAEELLRILRRMKESELDISVMAKLTGQEESTVRAVLDLLQTYPDESDVVLVKQIPQFVKK